MTTRIPAVLAEALDGEARPQSPFPWTKQPWLDQMHDLPDVLSLLDRLPADVSRLSTRDAVAAELDAGRVLPAFIAAMVWGWGTTAGMGALRTRWILTQTRAKGTDAVSEVVDPSVVDLLEAGAKSGRADGALEAFRLMNNEGRVLHLRSSYFTKWLYFTSAVEGPDDPNAAPIFDDRIVGWLKDPGGIRLEKNRTESYGEYLDLLASWGEPYGRTRAQVETEIFRLATGRG
ncbi:hypothetical protein [Arthrobacter sp. BE255]|uniref:8-oxoguanine DNA glycosylase OGG fold protein n=1 Tax=Arthrobacter sp. BE255 TaxID=2817721 RepID=UPI00285A6C0B|nr:hypothetical protein [Arthrobacter sp. BE255]MDR7161379.1 hypothetical protein [Arthrobacter sp. BE255]